MRRFPLPRAFTLIELTVVIAIIAILAGALLPVITQPYIQERRTETLKEMAAIEEGINGRPDLGDYGYVSTMGRVPASVSELLVRNAQAAPLLTDGINIGWNGPYVRLATSDLTTDAWGMPYQIRSPTAGGTIATTSYQLWSYGPDRAQGTGDDVYFPFDATTYWSTRVPSVAVDFSIASGAAIVPIADGSFTPTMRIPGDGVATVVNADAAIASGRATFTNAANGIPLGLHNVEFTYNGVPYHRPVLVSRAGTPAAVVINVPTSPTIVLQCAIFSTAAQTVAALAPCNNGAAYVVPAGGVNVTATFTGTVHSNVAGKRCYFAVFFDGETAFPAQLDVKVNVAASGYSPVAVESTTATAMTLTRTFAFGPVAGGTTIGGKVMVQPEGGGSCLIDQGALVIRAASGP
jgi:prepilin-type N-terminal cleavage/methylation domain-containing protein